MANARVIGSGPNGLAAAIVMAQAGVETTLFERNNDLGGACSTGELTLPGFHHDKGASVFPMGVGSPFLRSLALPVNLPWIEPEAPCAHPLDDGTAVMLEHSIAATAEGLDAGDRDSYRQLMEPLTEHFEDLAEDVLSPLLRVPKHPLVMARFGWNAVLPATMLASRYFKSARGRALFAGMAAHSVRALEQPLTAGVGLVLMAAGHKHGWPIAQGGAYALSYTLAGFFEGLGGKIEAAHEVTELSGGGWDVTLADVTPRQMLRMAGGILPAAYRRKLERFRYGAGSFKVDYALSEAIPWTAKECLRAATVHVGGRMEEIADSERRFDSERPFCLLVQPSLFDPARAPAGKHTAWVYCHVPNGSGFDWLERVERQIERFAPGFRECVMARAVSGPAALERWNPNLVGGDVAGGAVDWKQMFFRPTAATYRTPVQGLYLCGASTPPGGGVHGMAGFHAATTARKDLKI